MVLNVRLLNNMYNTNAMYKQTIQGTSDNVNHNRLITDIKIGRPKYNKNHKGPRHQINQFLHPLS